MRLTYLPGGPGHRRAVEETLAAGAADFMPPLNEKRIRSFADDASRPDRAILAFHKGTLVGTFIFKPLEPHDLTKHSLTDVERFRGYAYVRNLFVVPAFRRSGLGRRIRERGIDAIRAAGFRGVVATCWKKNEAMKRINRAMGFSLVASVLAPWRGLGEKSLIYMRRFHLRGKDAQYS